MSQAGQVVEVEPARRLRGWNGLLPSLQALGMVDEYAASGPTADPMGDLDEYGDVRPGLLTKPAHIVSADQNDNDRDLRRWEAGTTWRPIGYGDLETFTPCMGNTKGVSDQVANVVQFPVTLVADDQCSTWGNSNTPPSGYDFEERKRRALANLLRFQSNQAASELWTGAASTAQGWPNLSLSQSCTQLLAPGLSSPLTFALGSLQAFLAESLGDGQVGLIHCTRETATQWWAAGALYWNIEVSPAGGPVGAGVMPNVTYDIYGNVVIASGGYDGSDPDGTIDPAVPWAYASGPIRAQLGGVSFVPDEEWQAIQTDVNLETVRAERSAVMVFDQPSIAGIPVSLCDTCCATGS